MGVGRETARGKRDPDWPREWAEVRGLPPGGLRDVPDRMRMRALSNKPYLDTPFTPTRAEAVVDAFGDSSGLLESALDDGLNRTNLATLPNLTDELNGRRRFKEDPPIVSRRADRLRRELRDVLAACRRSLTVDRRVFLDRYTVTDVARKVVGVGSVGLGSYVLLLLGARSARPALFPAQRGAERPCSKRTMSKSPFEHNGQRVVAGQRIMQAASDPLLGWTQLGRTRFLRSPAPGHEGHDSNRAVGWPRARGPYGALRWRIGPRESVLWATRLRSLAILFAPKKTTALCLGSPSHMRIKLNRTTRRFCQPLPMAPCAPPSKAIDGGSALQPKTEASSNRHCSDATSTSRISRSPVIVRWTGHLPAISIRRAR